VVIIKHWEDGYLLGRRGIGHKDALEWGNQRACLCCCKIAPTSSVSSEMSTATVCSQYSRSHCAAPCKVTQCQVSVRLEMNEKKVAGQF